MALRIDQVASVERLDAEHVVRARIIATEAKRSFRLANHVGPAPLLLRLNRQSEMLLDGRHDWAN